VGLDPRLRAAERVLLGLRTVAGVERGSRRPGAASTSTTRWLWRYS